MKTSRYTDSQVMAGLLQAEAGCTQRFMSDFGGSATGRKTVEMVADSPLLRGLECHVVTVGNVVEALRWAFERLDGVPKRHQISAGRTT